MKLLYEDDLVESVVLAAASKKCGRPPDLQIRRFYQQRERCYAFHDPEQKAAAFAHAHLEWFVEWGFAAQLKALTVPFSAHLNAIEILAFRQSRRHSDEGAELYGDSLGDRRAVLALLPDRFRDPSHLACFAHHELGHIADMMDPDFGYDPDLRLAGITASQQRLVVERYRLLWAISIDGRLNLRCVPALTDKKQWRAEFDLSFAFLDAPRRTELFEACWTAELAGHRALLELAGNPRGLGHADTAVPGALCPLCGFAAFDWTDLSVLREEARLRIQAEHPHVPLKGTVCARCAEMYEAVVVQQYPATVCL